MTLLKLCIFCDINVSVDKCILIEICVSSEGQFLLQARAEAEDAAQLRAHNAAAVGRLHAMPQLPARAPQLLTVAASPQLRTATRTRLHDMSTRSMVGVRCLSPWTAV